MMETPFFGGSYVSLSSNAANDRTVNLYPEVMETKQGKQVGVLYSTPGQRAILTLPNFGVGSVLGPLRGSHTMPTTNKMVHVYGNTVMTVDINNVTVFLGFLNTASGPVSIIDNGTQILVVDGYQAWVSVAKTWTMITTLPGQPVTAVILDGFGLVNIYGTNQFYQSNLNDLTTWDPLSFSSADSEPSPIVGMATLFRQLWIFKQNSTEVWNNAGVAGFSFQRMQGVYLQVGALAPFSIATSAERLLWLGSNGQGSNSVYMNSGYEGKSISTSAVDYQIATYMKMTQKGCIDAIAFVYNQAGHTFYVITFPGGNATWVYDLATQLWHERGEWLNGVYARWDPSSYCFYNKQHVVGSGTTQQLSVLDMAYPLDDIVPFRFVNPKRWMRRWRASPQSMHAPVRFGSLRLDMSTGVTAPNSLYIVGHLTPGRIYDSGTYQYLELAGVKPYGSLGISSGSLPSGATMNATGLVTYKYNAPGLFNWSVSGSDSVGNTATLNDSLTIKSENLTRWILSPDGSTQSATCSGCADSIAFVGRNNGSASYTRDFGVTWTQLTGLAGGLVITNALKFNGSWYLLSNNLTGAISPGTTFSFSNMSNAPSVIKNSIAILNNQLYAGTGLPNQSSIVRMNAPNAPWTTISSGFIYGDVTGMCDAGGVYFFCTTQGKILKTTDFVTFTLAYDTGDVHANHLVYLPSKNLVVCSSFGVDYSSSDLGLTWVTRSRPGSYDIGATRTILFAGDTGTTVYTSLDNITWTAVISSSPSQIAQNASSDGTIAIVPCLGGYSYIGVS